MCRRAGVPYSYEYGSLRISRGVPRCASGITLLSGTVRALVRVQGLGKRKRTRTTRRSDSSRKRNTSTSTVALALLVALPYKRHIQYSYSSHHTSTPSPHRNGKILQHSWIAHFKIPYSYSYEFSTRTSNRFIFSLYVSDLFNVINKKVIAEVAVPLLYLALEGTAVRVLVPYRTVECRVSPHRG